MGPACTRLLPFRVSAGVWNMAADEALLRSAAAGTASMRFYGWTEATLSLGYFQPFAAALADPRLAGLPWLRRLTGGAAIVHHHELTYALALPAGRPWQTPGASWINRWHEIVRTVLAGFGIRAALCREEVRLGEVLCFLHHTPGDLLIGSAKVAGSAQRKRSGALLQHGSILLAQSPATPALPGITELSGSTLPVELLWPALVEEFNRATAWPIEAGNWTAEEEQAIAELLPRYDSPGWNKRR
jgi:lipoate-protein ligase A